MCFGIKGDLLSVRFGDLRSAERLIQGTCCFSKDLPNDCPSLHVYTCVYIYIIIYIIIYTHIIRTGI